MSEDRIEDKPATKERQGWRRGAAFGGVLVVLALAGAAGGYLIGDSTGEDLDAARAEGAEEGERLGAAEGAEEGYSEGYREGRKEGYEEAYERSYEAAYRKAFEEAGLDAPKKVSVPGE
jgi:flagellar biosynthesis/type III secretory pathway protein FliH